MSEKKKNVKIAVLMTCHNRISSTTACLKELKNQKYINTSIDLFLVDDGSIDETANAALLIFPEANIFTGDGNLYWGGGMRIAFSQAILKDYDFYLWLNDDTQLDSDALQRICQTYSDASSTIGDSLIIVGSTREQNSNTLTYGGWNKIPGRLFSVSWEKVEPDMNTWIPCDTMNGNVVLISRHVVQKTGILDGNFTHAIGDFDYGLRAKQNGCQILIAPGYYGTCHANDGTGLWSDIRLPIYKRWKKLIGPKGLPMREWLIFCSRHRGKFWVLAWLNTYVSFWAKALLRLFSTKI